jgi:putative peptide zinc metalloprotease protein
LVLDAQPTRAADATSRAPRLAQGVELVGEYEGSGFKETPYLARRGDGQTIQLSRLLYLVAEACDGRRTYDEIAAAVSERFGRRLSPGNAKTLVEDKLNPLGVVANHDGSQPVLSKPDSLLALRLRKGVIPRRAVRALTTLCYPLFLPPVVVAAVGALAAFDWWLFARHGVAQGVRETVMHPTVFLLMMAAVVVSAFLHECGHATGCRYGGGEPGEMGAGIYLAFPAFYTDVTDAYRLSKAGRLRTDLGGIYFNALFLLATYGAYFGTRFEPLLFLILVQHIEIAHQLLPLLRLDGYYVVADAVGVPDLFTRIGPILKSMVPWRRARDPRVTALKPWVRFFVTAWVVVVVPFLLVNLTMLLVHLPRLLGTGVASARQQWGGTRAAFGDGSWLLGTGGLLQLLLLILPFVGIGYTFVRLGHRVARRSWAWSADSAAKRTVVLLGGTALTALLVWAWLPGRQYAPIGPDERGTFGDYVAATETVLVDRGEEPRYTPAGTDDPDEAPADPAASPAPVVPEGTESATPGTTDTSPTPVPSESAAVAEPSATVSPEPTVSVTP